MTRRHGYPSKHVSQLKQQGGTLAALLDRQASAFDVEVTPEMARQALPEVLQQAVAETARRPAADTAPQAVSIDGLRPDAAELHYRAPAGALEDSRGHIPALQGYLSNPLEEQGREAIAAQFWEAPLGGYVRAGLDGVDLFGHTITPEQAHRSEQVLAAALASGIGVPTFLAGVQGLIGGNQQSAGTMPL